MNAEIITVGTEILLGNILNSNAKFLSEKLSEAGIDVYYHTSVGDNEERLFKAIELAISRADILIFSGGLGPTNDDITKEVVAKYFNKRLIFNEDCKKRTDEYFKKANRIPTENNYKQDYIPEGALILNNDYGTAPGCIIEEGKKIAIILPGPPGELMPMFENSVMPFLKSLSGCVIKSKTVKLFGIGESQASSIVNDMLVSGTNPTISPYAKTGEVHFRITAKAKSDGEADAMISQKLHEFKQKLGAYIYGYDDDTLENLVVSLLKENNLKLSTAESCTGGMIASKITSVSGASDVFGYGFVTYSNDAKIKLLGIPAEIIDKYGAVSSNTAVNMAYGARKSGNSNIGLSVTGIAGPTGGTSEKPVGLVYIGLSTCNGTIYKKLNLNGDRNSVREQTVKNALFTVLSYLRLNRK